MSKLVGYPKPMNIIEKEIEEMYPHTQYCKDKISELESKLKMTTDCLCDLETKDKRRLLRASLTRATEEAYKRGVTIGQEDANPDIHKIIDEAKAEQKEKDAKIAESYDAADDTSYLIRNQ